MTEQATTPSALARIFKARREELDLTQEDVAKRVTERLPAPQKLSQQTYAAFEKGKSQSSKHSTLIADVLDLPMGLVIETMSPGTFQYDSAPKTPSRPEANASFIAEPSLVWDDKPPLYDEVEVPLLKEVEDDAGRSTLQPRGTVKLRIDQATLLQMEIQPADIVCAKVSGNSMDPVIPDDSTVGIDTSRTAVKDGDIFAISHDNQLRVRMLYRLPRGGLRMRCFNRDEYSDEEYTANEVQAENIQILGRVFWYSVLR